MYKFIISATNKSNMLNNHTKEVCFIGRSNVGKSSLINAIANQKMLAKTSNTPGRTQLINFFQNNENTLVDLPGYGYAKMPLKIKKNMFKMLEEYFETREQLVKVFVLIDAKIGPSNDDIAMIEYLQSLNKNITGILTKLDKANQSQLFNSLKQTKKLLSDVIQVSSYNNKNISTLKKIINNVLK